MTSWIQLQGTVVFATQRFRLPHNFTLHFLGHLHQGNLKSNGHLELLKLVQLSKRCAVCIGFGNVGKDEDGTDGTAEVRSHLRHWEVATTVTSTDGKEPYALWIVVRPVGSCWGGRRCKGNTGYSGYRSYPLWNETKCRSFQFSGRPTILVQFVSISCASPCVTLQLCQECSVPSENWKEESAQINQIVDSFAVSQQQLERYS